MNSMIYKPTDVEKGSDFWILVEPEIDLSLFDDITAEYIQSNGSEVLAELTLDDGIIENSEGTGWILKLSNEITTDATTDLYHLRITFTQTSGEIIIKTIKNIINII